MRICILLFLSLALAACGNREETRQLEQQLLDAAEKGDIFVSATGNTDIITIGGYILSPDAVNQTATIIIGHMVNV